MLVNWFGPVNNLTFTRNFRDRLAFLSYPRSLLDQYWYGVIAPEEVARIEMPDQSMPGMSIDVLMSSMHELRSGLPEIMCADYSLFLGSRAGLELGAVGYLDKPITAPALRQLVNTDLACAS